MDSSFIQASPLLASLVIVFLAELGDKTLFTLMVLATKNHAVPVILGGWLAFVVQGLLAIALGSLVRLLPSRAIHWGTAAVFLGCGLWLLLKSEHEETLEASAAVIAPSRIRQFLTSFTLVFAAEFGDATQVGSAALVAQTGAPIRVFVGATLGLWLGTLLAVGVGRWVGGRFPSKVVRKLAGALFCVIAVATLAHSWAGP